jgi:hypothetical protein
MMMPHCKRDSQFELFESRPEGKLAPKLDLPFQRSSEVDVRRVASILAVSQNTVLSMLEYDSVIEHCNQLRVHYRISEDRLLRKPAHGRLRDEDLLPFPIAQTVFAKEVQRRLDIARQNVIYLIEQGDLVGYQVLIDLKASPYRIYRPSLERYMASLRIQAQSKTSARPR